MIANLQSIPVRSRVVRTDEIPVLDEFGINPYGPFEGKDGLYYQIVGNNYSDMALAFASTVCSGLNCYAEAMGWQVPTENPYIKIKTRQVHPNKKRGTAAVKKNFYSGNYSPGFLADKWFSGPDDMEACIKADLACAGRKCLEVYHSGKIPAKLPKPEEGSYWIKVMWNKDTMFHFMFKDPNSERWIHRLGWYMPPKVVMYEKDGHFYYQENDSADYISTESKLYKTLFVMRISD